MSGRGIDYDKRAVLIIARDAYAAKLAASTSDQAGRMDLRVKMQDLKEELRFLPST